MAKTYASEAAKDASELAQKLGEVANGFRRIVGEAEKMTDVRARNVKVARQELQLVQLGSKLQKDIQAGMRTPFGGSSPVAGSQVDTGVSGENPPAPYFRGAISASQSGGGGGRGVPGTPFVFPTMSGRSSGGGGGGGSHRGGLQALGGGGEGVQVGVEKGTKTVMSALKAGFNGILSAINSRGDGGASWRANGGA